MAGVNDVKEAVKVAKNEKKLTRRQTVLFIDEVHRFNKLQQVCFLCLHPILGVCSLIYLIQFSIPETANQISLTS